MEGKLQHETADQVVCTKNISNILNKPRLTGNVKDLKIPGQKENYEELGQNHSEKSMSSHSKTAPEN